ncbi:MAG: tetratricopeptide repeat protein [Trichodesmium sp. St16_bin4-tuft]|nr:tetratricopeptide repeat protein [Trichodesmium sp. MAG_R01]MDE5091550.1 tetratricopeptide repeat protein [Trichodesmium sp. St18_bin3_1_1]MDE5100654.1 tetratricopeptide repeat protein [Trichodesmium sp. St16_bin4-tuft]MDE5102014.1 tetratricopeptide repeat protein [Trichodesmium sp. St19_bin2]
MIKIKNLFLTSSFFYLYLSTSCLAKTNEFSEYTLKKISINIISQRQTEKEEELESLDIFSPNPLENTKPDPLLPNPPTSEIITGEKREKLSQKLEQLNVEAAALLAAGEKTKAFEIWNRELRLRRYLGQLEELAALSRVAEIAWDNSQKLQVQWITRRLQIIQPEIQREEPLNFELLQALGSAFNTVRAKDSAVEVYQQVISEARKQEDFVTLKQALISVGEIYLNWLDYDNAAIAYEELLDVQQQSNSKLSKIETTNPSINGNFEKASTLKQLAFIYSQGGKLLSAITAKERLVDFYEGQQNIAEVSEIKISIAEDYEKLGRLNLASQYYQEAYSIAQSIQQFLSASDALENLAALYLSQDEKEAAIEIYKVQLLMVQQFVNVYGMMEIYDRMGQVYAQLKAFGFAMSSFQKGLELSRQLGGYRESYFLQKLDKLNRNRNK